MKRIILPTIDEEQVCQEIGDFVVGKCLEMDTKGCVIGLSGGVDSTTTAGIIQRAFNGYNIDHTDRPLELVGYVLPTKINSPDDARDGLLVAERLGIQAEMHELDQIVEAYRRIAPEAFASNFHRGNMISRIRANVLSTKAATEGKIIAGTGNKDEDFGIGYYTLFGDGAVHFSPIGGLSKRLVKQMASYIGFANLADKEPTAGLEVGQTDFRDLGYSYDTIELITEGFALGLTIEDLVQHSQVVEYVTRDIGRYQSLFGTSKFFGTQEVTSDFSKRHIGALKKAKIISPDIAPVTLRYA